MASPPNLPRLALGLSLVFSACGPSETRLASSELHVYTFAGYIPNDLVSAFEAETGVKVAVSTYETNEELHAALQGRPTSYDLVVPSDYMVQILSKEHALRPLDLGHIPNYDNIERGFLTPYFDPGGLVGARGRERSSKYSLPYLWGTTGIAYDTSKVSVPPARWSDLWRPEFRGHLLLLDDAREMVGIGLLANGHDKNTRSTEEIAAAGERLGDLVAGAVALDSNGGERVLGSGEATVGVMFSGNAALAQRTNPNIAWVYPQDGAGIWFDNLAIPAKAAHPDAAESFIHFLLDAEHAARIGRDFPYCNPNQAALHWLEANDKDAYAAWTHNPVTYPSAADIAGALPVKDVGVDAARAYDAAWVNAKSKKGQP